MPRKHRSLYGKACYQTNFAARVVQDWPVRKNILLLFTVDPGFCLAYFRLVASMDPVGPTVAGIELAIKIIRKCKQFKDAPDDVKAFMSNVEHLRTVFDQIKTCAVAENRPLAGDRTQLWEAAIVIVRKTSATMVSIESLLSYQILTPESAYSEEDAKVRRIAWMRSKKKILGLHKELKAWTKRLSEISGLMMRHDLNDLRAEMQALLAATQTMSHLRETDCGQTRSMYRSSGEIPETDRTVQPVRVFDNPFCVPLDAPIRAILDISEMPSCRPACRPFCDCSCHELRTLELPRYLSIVFGTLYICYAGTLSSHCDVKSCESWKRTRLYGSFQLPHWLSTRSMCIITNGPKSTLAFPRRIHGHSKIVRYIQAGWVEGLRSLLREGEASEWDIVGPSRAPIILRRTNVTRSAAGFMLDDLIAGTADQSLLDMYKSSIDVSEVADMQRFTRIHRIITGLETSISLETELRITTKEIDLPDLTGRTPLHLAVKLGKDNHVRVLLQYGASIDYRDHYHESLLHMAARAESNPATLRVLLDTGMNPNCANIFQETPLMLANSSLHQDRLEKLTMLFTKGADLNWCSPTFTGLRYSCLWIHGLTKARQPRQREELKFLLTRGCTPTDVDILHMVTNDCTDALELIRSYFPILTTSSQQQEEVFRRLLIHASAETIELFLGQDWTGASSWVFESKWFRHCKTPGSMESLKMEVVETFTEIQHVALEKSIKSVEAPLVRGKVYASCARREFEDAIEGTQLPDTVSQKIRSCKSEDAYHDEGSRAIHSPGEPLPQHIRRRQPPPTPHQKVDSNQRKQPEANHLQYQPKLDNSSALLRLRRIRRARLRIKRARDNTHANELDKERAQVEDDEYRRDPARRDEQDARLELLHRRHGPDDAAEDHVAGGGEEGGRDDGDQVAGKEGPDGGLVGDGPCAPCEAYALEERAEEQPGEHPCSEADELVEVEDGDGDQDS
ncbi:hypothetical protein FH972_025479 [Carpinus fangiana]|uniref:Uncharacterized protein n=1 Tax=Carpinus fangiana TaxID=176857 RepID=A0A5N6L262_9ROSI|nr:hypothetical protein FH972_025479 [Carpinus fangiana]